jgi:hypothetical protein
MNKHRQGPTRRRQDKNNNQWVVSRIYQALRKIRTQKLNIKVGQRYKEESQRERNMNS